MKRRQFIAALADAPLTVVGVAEQAGGGEKNQRQRRIHNAVSSP
jgi:hypothetical protein